MRTGALLDLIEACCVIGTEWFKAERKRCAEFRAAGVAVPMPPCCLGCVEPPIRYEMPAADQRCQNWYLPPDVLSRGLASCLDAAIFEVSAARSKGKSAHVELEPISFAGSADAVEDWHAVAYIEGKRKDSSKNLATPAVDGFCSC
jgi:hypothetical protein